MTPTDYINKHLSNYSTEKGKDIIEIPDSDRIFLAKMFADLGYSVGAEIGVERGIYSKILLDNNPALTLYSIDAWTAYKGYRDHVTQSKMDKIHQDCIERLANYIQHERSYVIKSFSTTASEHFKDNSLDFVYIDANHEYAQTVADISAWDKKVKVGGIVAGHDYILRKDPGYLMHVPHAIHGWCKSYNIKPLYILGRKEKITGERRENTRSWFYIKKEQSIVPAKPLEL